MRSTLHFTSQGGEEEYTAYSPSPLILLAIVLKEAAILQAKAQGGVQHGLHHKEERRSTVPTPLILLTM